MSDLISLQIKQLKEAKYILKLWMINYIKKKTEYVWEERAMVYNSPLSSWSNGHIKSYLFSAADNCDVWFAVVCFKSFSWLLFFLSTAPVISYAINNSILFKTKLQPRVTLKNKNYKESQATQASRCYTVECVFVILLQVTSLLHAPLCALTS